MHVPVLLQEAIQYLAPRPGENFVDATAGQGGHLLEILRLNAPTGKVLAMDWDAASLHELESRTRNQSLNTAQDRKLGERLMLVNDNFSNIEKVVAQKDFQPVYGILFDLGYSSWQMEKSGRGFSFLRDEPLDMRLSLGRTANGEPLETSRDRRRTAAEIVNAYPKKELERILWEYGEERFTRHIVRDVIRARREHRIVGTKELADIVTQALPARYRHGRIHAATKTFQALRIAVNNELDNLGKALNGAVRILEPGGRIVIMAFHSLEDRIVKNFFRDKQKAGELKIVTKKPVRPSREEMLKNPRSRSAKLRAAVKT